MYSSLMIVAGLGIPVMAALNGGLGAKLQSPALAAVILFTVGLVISAVYLAVTAGLPAALYIPSTPWYFYCGGFFVSFYVLTITWVAPRFGISNAIAFVLLGQLVAMSIIDHFALMGAPHYALNAQRFFGLILMIAGVFMILNKAPDL